MFGGQEGEFAVDFGQFIKKSPSQGFGGIIDSIGDAFADAVDSMTGEEKPLKTFPDFLPLTFYVRLLAQVPGGGYSPSNTVIVRYLPSGEVLTNLSPSGPIYEAQIVEYIPFRPADPAYKACTVLTQDLVFQSKNSDGEVTSQTVMPAGTQSCGCPGVKCSSGSSSDCDIAPWKWGNCLAQAGEWFVNAVKDTVNYAADLYSDAKSFVIDTVASFACSFIDEEDADEKAACETAINIAANVAITAFTGIPPEIPNFDKLFDEGLEYALATAVSQATGIECDQTCRDLLKKGFEAASDPEKLYEEGLDYGASLVLEELEDQGLACDSSCQNTSSHTSPYDHDIILFRHCSSLISFSG